MCSICCGSLFMAKKNNDITMEEEHFPILNMLLIKKSNDSEVELLPVYFDKDLFVISSKLFFFCSFYFLGMIVKIYIIQ